MSKVSWFYAIVDVEACARAGVAPLVHAERCLERGASWVQLRAKLGADDHHVALATAMLAMCNRAAVPFVVNDRVALAAAIGAPMAHVGQGDGSARGWAARAPNVRLGRSTHAIAELRAALAESPAYVAFGPVFPTESKRNPEPVVGLELLGEAHAIARAKAIPLVAIGGIDGPRLPQTLAHCDAVAFISALLPVAGEGAREPFLRLGLTGA